MPFHSILSILLLAAALLLCAIVYAFGRKPISLSPFPGSDFPNVFDKVYLAVFLIIFSLSLASSLCGNDAVQESKTTWFSLLSDMFVQLCFYLPMLIRWSQLPRRERLHLDFGTSIAWIYMALGVVFLTSRLMVVLHVDTYIMQWTGCPAEQSIVELMQKGDSEEKLVLITTAVLMAPICEECCFRGFLYNLLRTRAGIIPSSLAVGLLFGAIHTSLVQFLPLTVFGIVQCIAYEKAKSLWLPITVHIVFNALSCFYICLIS